MSPRRRKRTVCAAHHAGNAMRTVVARRERFRTEWSVSAHDNRLRLLILVLKHLDG